MYKVGWIGTGVMGSHMCKHLMTKGKYVTNVYNRTAAKAKMLVDAGASFKKPKQIATESDIVFLMLGYPHDVESMVLGRTGILKHMKPGSYLIDHTTSSPGLATEIYEQAKKLGIHSLDAPVSGGDIGAKNGQVVTMVGAEPEAFSAMEPLMNTYSKTIRLMGGPGKGQHTKCVNQIMIANNMMGV